jgi:hypothetical protein
LLNQNGLLSIFDREKRQNLPPHLNRRALYPVAKKKEVTLCQEHRAFPIRCGGKPLYQIRIWSFMMVRNEGSSIAF